MRRRAYAVDPHPDVAESRLMNITIAKARVVAIEEMLLKRGIHDPEKTPNSVIASRLQIEPINDEPAYRQMSGTIHVPKQLQFGKTYHLTLVDPDTPVREGRRFQEENE